MAKSFTFGLRSRGIRLWSLLAITTACLSAAPARAACQLTFSTKSSDSTPPSAIPATATFSVVGSQLQISINNSSAYQIADLYFNTDATLTGLAFASDPQFAAFSVSGGPIQSQNAGGFGDFNYRLDFGNAQTFLGPGITSLVLDMTGTTSESAICNTFGANPSNSDNLAIAVLKFQSGPRDDSAFGATDQPGTPITGTGDLVPEGNAGIMLACGVLPLALLALRRGRKRTLLTS